MIHLLSRSSSAASPAVNWSAVIGRHVIAMVGRLPDGISDSVGVVAIDAGGGQLTDDGEGVEHRTSPVATGVAVTTWRSL